MENNFILLNIKYLFKNKKYTQNYLSSLLDEKKSTINNILNKETYPKHNLIIKICKEFNISIDDFYTKDLSKNKEYYTLGNTNTDLVNEKDLQYNKNQKLIDKIKSLESKIELLESKYKVSQEEIKLKNLQLDILEEKQDAAKLKHLITEVKKLKKELLKK